MLIRRRSPSRAVPRGSWPAKSTSMQATQKRRLMAPQGRMVRMRTTLGRRSRICRWIISSGLESVAVVERADERGEGREPVGAGEQEERDSRKRSAGVVRSICIWGCRPAAGKQQQAGASHGRCTDSSEGLTLGRGCTEGWAARRQPPFQPRSSPAIQTRQMASADITRIRHHLPIERGLQLWTREHRYFTGRSRSLQG
jgi:hypothetical protein